METRDASDGQVRPGMTAAEFAQVDFTRVHGLTGPVAIQDASPGDALEIKIEAIEHEGWAWTSLIPQLGLLPEDFDGFHLHHWQLDKETTDSMPGLRIPLAPFAGIIGLQPAASGSFRTRPPGVNGGNMDVRHLTAGSRLWLPVAVAGGGLCIGDCHAAQGDGEVCINGMEAPMRVTVSITLHKQHPLDGPFAWTHPHRVPPQLASAPWMTFIESDVDPRVAAQRVVRRAIGHICGRTSLTREQAYIVCSVALDLKLSQLVNQPMTTVSGYLPEGIFL